MEQYYYELTLKPNLYYELFLDLALSLTEDAIEEQEDVIIIRSEEELDNIKEGIEAFAKELSNAFETEIICEIQLIKKSNQDWIKLYQESVQPIEIGKFYIHPSWSEPKKNKVNIVIDPTLAFGSGHHETTNTCIQAIEKYVKKDMEICDIGTGSGILAIAAAKLDAKVDICDTDPIALKDSLKNFETNSVIANKSWEGSVQQAKTEYNIVIANIVADVLVMISKDLVKNTKEDGILILSGIMEQYEQKVTDKFEKDCNLIDRITENEWVTLILKKSKDNK